jgi:TolB-like protein
MSVTHPLLDSVLNRLLRKHPAERYPSVDAVLDALPAASHRSAAKATNPTLLTSIAVLPFVFLGDVEDTRALSLGFADALITIFANLADVIVTPTSAILNYPAGAEPSRACRDLGVRYSLQGTIQKLGARWRVSMQLFDVTAQKITLSEKHDFNLSSVFDVQDEVGRRIVESLQRRFPSGVRRSRDRYSSDPEAYREFMAGLRESSSDHEGSLWSAVEHLSTAIQRDPDFALAHATLSFVSMHLYFQFDSRRTLLQQAEDHCSRALALDAALPEAHLARAWILWSPAKNFQHVDAIAALERVLAAQPNFERAHNRMSSICLHIGRLEDARAAHERAQRTNPQTRSGNLEWFYLMSGDFERAEEATAAWLRDRPGNTYARISHALPPLFSGDLDLADERLAAAEQQLPNEPMVVSLQGIVLARRRQADLALECVRKTLESPRSLGHTHHTYHYLAGVYAVLGETDKAMAWLERSVDSGWACWPFFRIDPHLENLRETLPFKRLVADLEQTYTAIEIARF